jgi:hypothetical protein
LQVTPELLTDITPKNSILANEPGAFQVEVQCSELDSLGLHSQEGEEGVLLTVVSGGGDISLQLSPSDIPRLKDALDLCQRWSAAEQAAERTPTDGAAAQP